MKSSSHFRLWVHQLWLDNCEEHFIHAEPVLDQREYFQRYKYWLKREFRHRQTVEKRKILEKQTVDQKIANSYNHTHNIHFPNIG